ncbi:MAG: 2-oxo acid dehydrogenase subunit E2 [Bacteroidia bacterium]|nr:2-oxo acid dehydrogenase subunit E2 [Bacteroidia bacterium]MCC6767645.1 2-oxo acid dehydrogenase subunit E2 [Bacteroidia bacterium]
MAKFELIMPKMGESVAEATIIKWLKNPGDTIELDEAVLEIATDKVDSEIPSPVAGILEKHLFNEGDTIQVNGVIAIINTSGEAATTPAAPAQQAIQAKETPLEVPFVSQTLEVSAIKSVPGGRFYSPLVRSMAKLEQISQAELDAIAGSGKDGRLTKDDMLAYLETRKSGKAVKPAGATNTTPVKPQAPAVSVSGGDEIIEMDRMRKLIADHMVMSKSVSPHVTSFIEADVTNMVLWREKVKKEFEKKEGEKITFTPIIIEAVARAIRDFPMINISVDGTKIIKKKNINVGMATALPSGNLIVPVIKNADTMNLVGLSKAVNDLANRARNNKLSPDEIAGGTFTITNVGSFGNVMGTPIINQPQVAIMAIGVIKKKPAVLETPQGDVIAIRHMMFCSLSYDHRVVDGSLGGSFLRRVADYLEAFDINRPI